MNRKLCLTAAFAGSLMASAASATEGAPITVTPSPLSFNAPQSVAKTRVLTVTNSSGASISFGPSTISGPDAGDVGVGTDTCANHTIQNGKKCHVHVVVTTTAAVGTVETATISINSSGGSSLATDDINATVTDGPLSVTAKSRTVTIKNKTANAAFMDYSTFGNLQVTGGSCTDYISQHTSCTLLVTLTPPDDGDELQVQLNAGNGNQYFDLYF
jgi:hypothetical protein